MFVQKVKKKSAAKKQMKALKAKHHKKVYVAKKIHGGYGIYGY